VQCCSLVLRYSVFVLQLCTPTTQALADNCCFIASMHITADNQQQQQAAEQAAEQQQQQHAECAATEHSTEQEQQQQAKEQEPAQEVSWTWEIAEHEDVQDDDELHFSEPPSPASVENTHISIAAPK
jgi:hypothetical protein